MKKNYYLSFFISMFIIGALTNPGFAQPMYHTNPTISSGGNSIPWAYNSQCRGQQVYPVGVFGNPPSGQMITKLYWIPGTSYTGTYVYSNLEVYLKQDNITSLSTVYETGMTQVFNATNYSLSYVGGQWFEIELQQPFLYDPTKPLIWEVNQLGSSGSTFYCLSNTTAPGAYRNYSTQYNAASATGSGAYMLACGFDLAPASTAENDAGVTSIDSPASFCPGNRDIIATVKNFGINQVNSVTVNWRFNGQLQTPVTYQQLLDTFNGNFPNEAQVLLGTKTFVANQVDEIVAWTTMPNNIADTSNKNDTTTVELQPALSGSYTIDPNGSGQNNYLNFADAIKDLNDFGVCGAVTYDVAAGTYNEQIGFGAIEGASATNTITFIGDSSGVIVQYGASSSTDNFVVQFSGSEYVTLDNFTFQNGNGGSTSYRKVFDMSGGASYNTIRNCEFIGYPTSSSSSNIQVFYAYGGGMDYNKFHNNVIDANGQYYGFYFYGASGSENDGNEFIGNEFKNAYYYGGLIYYSKNQKFNYNSIESNQSPQYGLYVYYAYDNTEIIGNKMYTQGGYGMRLYYIYGTPSDNALVANNWITAGNGTSYVYGMYLYNLNFARVVHNTIWRNNGASTGYYGIYMTQGTSNELMNNMIYAPVGSSSYYGIYVASAAYVSKMDGNNVFTNANYGYYNGVRADLSAWKSAGGGDNSYDFDPAYTIPDSLRHCNDSLDNTGVPIEYLTTDIDMDARNANTPDIGADEFVGGDSSNYSAGPDGELCNGVPIEIGAPITGGSYVWSTSATSPTIMVNTPGTYTVEFTSSCGGFFIDQIDVTDITPVASFTYQVSFQSGIFTNTSKNGDTYMWVINGTDTIHLKDIHYIFEDNGPHDVCLYTMNKCDTVMQCQQWQGVVGIEETAFGGQIALMPNPATENVFIQFNDIQSDNIRIEMTNVQGQVVYRNQFVDVKGSTTKSIDVSSLNKGIYMIRFISDSDIATKQLVVK